MKNLRLLTWLDVRRTICRKTNYGTKLPEGVARMDSFSNALEIGLDSDKNIDSVKSTLKEWFGDSYQENQSIIQLDLGNESLSVEFSPGEQLRIKDKYIRPFWDEITYIDANSAIKLPEPYRENPNLLAFYSFNDGVEKTVNLVAYLLALLDKAKQLDNQIKVLVIDAALNTPGLTYWNINETDKSSISYINFLELVHYSPVDEEQTLLFIAQELQNSSKQEGKSTVYFLPAYINDEQLLDIEILPEHIITYPNKGWELGDYIHKLGQAVGADYVLIDLGSGLNKISSPILLDTRFQRFLVTTINEPSVAGTALCLSQMKKVAPKTSNNDKYYDPSVILSMLTPEIIASPAYKEVLQRFQSAYIQSEQQNNSTMLEIAETYLAPELLYIDNWEDASSKLASTSILENAANWANKQVDFNKIILENLDPVVIEKLQVRATRQGRNLLEELKVIVEEALQEETISLESK
ncbi:hypothetical protein DSM106972_000900 [Dulcicalothrix desertica PCC 7102]|uniref:Uncharacterized protein n=1 Tax=Dulcicalothrix desertica PCC 7102 TaxID=232991 RepID=A0A433VU14_9CYAN|nr:hypothetical protein [Dulcicalothrix desertica]RUT09596.1 hypothetical protein DSM106972_000900 [Dulcicalothrix desertica PCC 7102]TWH50795.1 hypothetical protein CAL7102_05139 [Dulcicalothrix desertica PCC 7102]